MNRSPLLSQSHTSSNINTNFFVVKELPVDFLQEGRFGQCPPLCVTSLKGNLNDRTHLERGWIGVFNHFKRSPNISYPTLKIFTIFPSFYKHFRTQSRDHMQIWMQQYSPTRLTCKSHAHVQTLPIIIS